eukprot:4284748-Prymnesium_polylepis.1
MCIRDSSTGEHGMREQAAEARMVKGLPRRVPAEERLVDVDLPQAQRLGEVTVLPRRRLPHIGHRHRARAELVVVVHEMEVLAVEGVHARLRRLVRVLDALARLVGCVPLLDLWRARQQVTSGGHKEHRLLRIMPARDDLNAPAIDIEYLDEARVQPTLAALLWELA